MYAERKGKGKGREKKGAKEEEEEEPHTKGTPHTKNNDIQRFKKRATAKKNE